MSEFKLNYENKNFKTFWINASAIYLSGEKTLIEIESFGILNPVKMIEYAALEAAQEEIKELTQKIKDLDDELFNATYDKDEL